MPPHVVYRPIKSHLVGFASVKIAKKFTNNYVKMSQQQLQPTRSSTVESTNSSISNTSLNSRGHDPRKQSLQRYNQLVIEQLQQQQQHHHYQTPNFAPSPSAASNIIYSSQQSLGQQQQQSSSVSPNNNNNNSLHRVPCLGKMPSDGR
jgi:hypothetical protein